MTYVYSNDELEDVNGAYIAPHLFDGVEANATKVYAKDEHIIKAYKDAGVEVIELSKPEKKAK